MSNILNLTESAIKKINTLCEDKNCYGVSLNVKGGGCAGYEYDWGFILETDLTKTDEIINTGSGNLVVAAESVMFLLGSTVNFKEEVFGANFEITNPVAASACGCGTSFNIDMDTITNF